MVICLQNILPPVGGWVLEQVPQGIVYDTSLAESKKILGKAPRHRAGLLGCPRQDQDSVILAGPPTSGYSDSMNIPQAALFSTSGTSASWERQAGDL